MTDPTAPVAAGSTLPTDPRFHYYKITQASLSVAQLDALMNFVINSPKGYAGAVIAGVKIAVVLWYTAAREKLALNEALLAKQEYEQAQGNQNQSDIDKDNLSGAKK